MKCFIFVCSLNHHYFDMYKVIQGMEVKFVPDVTFMTSLNLLQLNLEKIGEEKKQNKTKKKVILENKKIKVFEVKFTLAMRLMKTNL